VADLDVLQLGLDSPKLNVEASELINLLLIFPGDFDCFLRARVCSDRVFVFVPLAGSAQVASRGTPSLRPADKSSILCN
jgi:hypothetical protein